MPSSSWPRSLCRGRNKRSALRRGSADYASLLRATRSRFWPQSLRRGARVNLPRRPDGAADCFAAVRLGMTNPPYGRSIPDRIDTPSDFFVRLRAKVSGIVEAADAECLWNPRF